MNRFWRLSLRARLMIIGLTGVAVALILGGLVAMQMNAAPAIVTRQDEPLLAVGSPGVRKPGQTPAEYVRSGLTVAPEEALRSELMPVNDRYRLRDVLAAFARDC